MSTTARFTLAEYDRMIERGIFDEPHRRRIELIHGELRDMTPAGPTHEEVITTLMLWSVDNVDRGKTSVRIQCSIGLPDLDSAPEPDVAWVVAKSYREERPAAEDVLLIIEVADSSLRYDRGEKANLYAQAGIEDYWIVNLLEWCIEVYRDPDGETYQTQQRYDSEMAVSPLAFPNLALPVRNLFQT